MTFTPTMETERVTHINEVESMLFGFTGAQLRKIAFQFAEETGRQWLRCFMSRHSDELSLRMPEATSAASARAFNEVSVAAFFDILEKLQEKKFTPDRIFNVAETGILTVPNRSSRIIAEKGENK